MKNLCITISIFVIIKDVTAKDDNMTDGDGLACCARPAFLIPEIHFPCFNPVNNVTTPNRVGCMTSYGRFNFTVKPGVIEYQIGGETETTDGAEACYGNLHRTYNSTHSDDSEILLICERDVITKFRIYQYTVITSSISLSATAVIYAIFPELRDIFGMSITNFCGSLAISTLQYAFVFETKYGVSCIIRAYTIYFFIMAAFFWSNSISIQILRDTRRPSKVDRGWKEFRWYCLYSWGFPTMLTTIAAVVDYHPGDHKKPGFNRYCWFSSDTQEWYYLNGIMLILLLINLAIFIYVATILWRFALKSTYLKTLRFKLSMTIRLMLVMGLPWFIKTLGLAAADTSFLAWFVLELMTAMQGILIFLVLVMRKKVVRVLHQRGLLACCSGSVDKWLAARDDESCEIHPNDLQTDMPMQD